MSVSFCGIDLAHPIINASGTFDPIAASRTFGDAAFAQFPFAAYVTKTVTVNPRQGNPPPRLWELPTGLMNSIGLPNKGLTGWIENDLPVLDRLGVPLIANVMGFNQDEFREMIEGVSSHDQVRAIELNVSCPNVKTGTVIGSDPDECHGLLSALRPLTDKPLIVKITPNASAPELVAQAAADAGADAVSLINTLRGMALDPLTGEPWLGGKTGGVSGPAIRAVSLAQTEAVCSRVAVPVIAMGGVSSGRDASDLINVGARLVAVGTESFRDPDAGRRIADELFKVDQT